MDEGALNISSDLVLLRPHKCLKLRKLPPEN